MSNLIDLQSQIDKLQKQANDIRAKEFDKTVRDILATMQAFGISVKDLQSAGGRGAKGKVVAAGKKTKPKSVQARTLTVAAKYRGPNGETWSGRGLTPRWLAALINEGREKTEFAVDR